MTVIKPKKGAKLDLVTRTQPINKFQVPARPKEIPASMGKEFSQVCRNLHSEGLWHDDRLPIVATFMHNIYVFRTAAAVLEAHGLFDETGKPHPAQLSAQRAQNAALVAAKALGLTVSATIISRQGVPEKSPGTVSTGGKWAAAGGAK